MTRVILASILALTLAGCAGSAVTASAPPPAAPAAPEPPPVRQAQTDTPDAAPPAAAPEAPETPPPAAPDEPAAPSATTSRLSVEVPGGWFNINPKSGMIHPPWRGGFLQPDERRMILLRLSKNSVPAKERVVSIHADLCAPAGPWLCEPVAQVAGSDGWGFNMVMDQETSGRIAARDILKVEDGVFGQIELFGQWPTVGDVAVGQAALDHILNSAVMLPSAPSE